jgi:hypothetical protein
MHACVLTKHQEGECKEREKIIIKELTIYFYIFNEKKREQEKDNFRAYHNNHNYARNFSVLK